MARTTADLVPVWRSTLPPVNSADSFLTGTNLGVPDEFAASAKVAGSSHPGYSADPDMLVVGLPWSEYFVNHLAINREIVARDRLTPGRLKKLSDKFTLSDEQLGWRANAQPALTESEQHSHFSLWAMLGAPLIAGNDVRSMTDATRAILTNADVISVDQDPLVAEAAPAQRILAVPSNRLPAAMRPWHFSTPTSAPQPSPRMQRSWDCPRPRVTRFAICGRIPTPRVRAQSAIWWPRTTWRCCASPPAVNDRDQRRTEGPWVIPRSCPHWG
jgi:hypothetical protein